MTEQCAAEELTYKGYFAAHLDGCVPEDTLVHLAAFGCTKPDPDCTIIVCEHHIDDFTLAKLGTTLCATLI